MSEDAAVPRGGRWADDEPRPSPSADPPPGGRRPAAPSGAGLDRRTAEQAVEHYANHIANTVGSAFMYMTTSGVFREVDCQAFKRYRDNLIAGCGSPSDPIEVMLIEQMALANLNIGRLHFRSATADGLEGARVYGALAIGLTGELRRTAIALQAYREKSRAIEAGPSQAATSPVVDPGLAYDRQGVVTEQGSKVGGDEHGHATIPIVAESSPGRGREAEQVEKARPKRRRA